MNSNSTATDCITDAPHEPLRRGQRPLTPDEDPFYQPPKGYEQAQPGAVLRSREVELGFLGVIPQRITAIQLLYRSTNLHGEPEVAVTTVLVPAERDPELMCPVLSYQCAIDAVVSRCFPSYALRRGARPIGAFVQSEFLLVAAALAEGWSVSVPDHEGCHGMWGSPYEPGYRILDGVDIAEPPHLSGGPYLSHRTGGRPMWCVRRCARGEPGDPPAPGSGQGDGRSGSGRVVGLSTAL